MNETTQYTLVDGAFFNILGQTQHQVLFIYLNNSVGPDGNLDNKDSF
jgi:hypothetical protein